MSFSKRAVHTLEGDGTAIGVTDCHAYVDGQVMCLSHGSLDGAICFGKSNRHVVRLDGWGSVLRARGFVHSPVFHNNTSGGDSLHCGISTRPMSDRGQTR